MANESTTRPAFWGRARSKVAFVCSPVMLAFWLTHQSSLRIGDLHKRALFRRRWLEALQSTRFWHTRIVDMHYSPATVLVVVNLCFTPLFVISLAPSFSVA